MAASVPTTALATPRPHDRWVAPGGWRRAVSGIAVGAIAGAVLVAADRRDRTRGSRDHTGRRRDRTAWPARN